MLNFVIRGLKVLAVLCTLLLVYLVYISVAHDYPWREHWIGMLLLQLAVFLYRRAARLLDRGKRSGAILGLICVVFGPTPTLFTDVHPAVQWFWPILLGVPLVVVWFQLGKRRVSVVDRVPEAL
jgi:hypothetical protein